MFVASNFIIRKPHSLYFPAVQLLRKSLVGSLPHLIYGPHFPKWHLIFVREMWLPDLFPCRLECCLFIIPVYHCHSKLGCWSKHLLIKSLPSIISLQIKESAIFLWICPRDLFLIDLVFTLSYNCFSTDFLNTSHTYPFF